MNNPHPNQFAQVQYLRMMYRGIVDDDVLERFTNAILEADTMPAIPDGKPVDRQWILAADLYGNSLTLGHRGTIESAAVIAAAKSWASTWGQFLARVEAMAEDP